ncbi:hypothetical protein BDR26DRAFT_1013424 [Obelidium mucronatum]|nr:hypothetical protein BDR26DRAFT_1013424 [Obelidium mucronatum]
MTMDTDVPLNGPPRLDSGLRLYVHELVVIGLLVGLTAEVAISGLLSTLVFSIGLKEQAPAALLAAKRKKSRRNYIAAMMTNFNLASSAVSSFHPWVVKGATIVLLHRVIWTCLDLMWSGGHWNPDASVCYFSQNPISGLGYNFSDILVDLCCTIVSIRFAWKHLNSKITRIGEVILEENVARSAVMLTVNSLSMYASLTITDPFLTLVAFMIQNHFCNRLSMPEFRAFLDRSPEKEFEGVKYDETFLQSFECI